MRRTTGLLRAAGIDAKTALAVAQQRPLADVARFVAVWQSDMRARRVDGPGALLHRLQDPDWQPPVADQETLRYGILARFVTEQDLRNWSVGAPQRTGLEAYEVPAGYEDLVKH